MIAYRLPWFVALLGFAEAAFAQTCASDFDCASSAQPACVAGSCAAGPSACVGDDAGDAGGSDDGPAGARNLNAGSAAGAICSTPDHEQDYYDFDVQAGISLVVGLSWTGESNLDLAVFDSSGAIQGFSLHRSPETVELSYLPAGTHFIRVVDASIPGSSATTAYTIGASAGTAQVCVSRADCADAYSTQLLRGTCASGPCTAQAANASVPLGSPCDRDANCASGLCSYLPFAAGADRAVCTISCSTHAECDVVAPGFRCTTGLAPNRCVAPCSNDLQCGADVASTALDPGQPWDYLACTLATSSCSAPVRLDALFANGFEGERASCAARRRVPNRTRSSQ